MTMYGLVDCNNFFASCERVFHPELRNRPVVVLSNNDGCIIARSNEAKALGVPMGSPYFKVKSILEQNNVAVFSSNHTLYGDMSRRVMSLLSDFVPDMEIYSIDEAFVHLEGLQTINTEEYVKGIVKSIYKGVGIPVTIGVAPTKTLAKVAAYFGKKYPGYKGVCVIDSEEKRIKALMKLPVSEVWGIGRRHSKTMEQFGISTAWDFVQKKESWVKSMFTVTGVRTWKELHGIDCIERDDVPEKKSICTSRSFAGKGIGNITELEEMVANFASDSARKLRLQNSVCSAITLYVRTDRYNQNAQFHQIYKNIILDVPTNDTAEIIKSVLIQLRQEFIKGCFYKKAGVILWNISPESHTQAYLFDSINRIKQKQTISVIDKINRTNGKNTIRIASQSQGTNNLLKKEHCSKMYTTNINDIIKVKA